MCIGSIVALEKYVKYIEVWKSIVTLACMYVCMCVLMFLTCLVLLYDSLLGNHALTSVSLPTSLVIISDYVFQACSALPTVIIPT